MEIISTVKNPGAGSTLFLVTDVQKIPLLPPESNLSHFSNSFQVTITGNYDNYLKRYSLKCDSIVETFKLSGPKNSEIGYLFLALNTYTHIARPIFHMPQLYPSMQVSDKTLGHSALRLSSNCHKNSQSRASLSFPDP